MTVPAFNFENQVVVITGGCGGLGHAMTKGFVETGARVVRVDLAAATEESTNCRTIEADVSDFARVQTCVEDILSTEGKVDCLINNAGISRDAVIWKMTEAQWDHVLNVNLKGTFNFVHHLAPHFRQANRGKIVNISSINGLRGKFGLANYSASKAGLIALTKTVARELGRHNVNVNAVAPGYVLTPLTQKLPPEIIQQAREETVLGRLAAPDDVANVVLFLCSDLAKHITGEVIKIDGGQYI